MVGTFPCLASQHSQGRVYGDPQRLVANRTHHPFQEFSVSSDPELREHRACLPLPGPPMRIEGAAPGSSRSKGYPRSPHLAGATLSNLVEGIDKLENANFVNPELLTGRIGIGGD